MKHFKIIRIRREPNPVAFGWEFGIPPEAQSMKDYWIGRKKLGGYDFFVVVGSLEFNWMFDLQENDLLVVAKKKDPTFRHCYRIVDLDRQYLLLKPYEEKERAQAATFIDKTQTSDD